MSYKIYRLNANTVIDFAATELKKYLRMMMPRCGEIPDCYDTSATDGFRLGTFEDFKIDLKVKSTRLDDMIYIDTDLQGGIIAGVNPRSVLLAVYHYLRENGCRWLFPGPDGEHIPVHEIKPVKVTFAPSYRYRGQCNEGAQSQQVILDMIDFVPKAGLNTFMMEGDIPTHYYAHFYNHMYQPGLEPEMPSDDVILQWKRACDIEIARRGIMLHDMGHGWSIMAFDKDEKELGATDHLSLINGTRAHHDGNRLNTNMCMSNPHVRDKMTDAIVNYAKVQNNVDFLHVWLGDSSNSHCECESCKKMTPSDWYLTMMNETDEKLSALNLDTHIVFIAYIDTIWPPETVKLRNPDRFTMLFAPITRLYTESYSEDADMSAVVPYERNKLKFPHGMAQTLGYLKEWKKMWQGDCYCYEYHFWITQYYDIGTKTLAKTIYNDVQGLKKHGLSGIVEDGSQRSFYPNGFLMYVYSQALYNSEQSYEDIERDFFSHAYGDDWEKVNEFLSKLSELFDFSYVYDIAKRYLQFERCVNYEEVGKMGKVIALLDSFKPVIAAHKHSGMRAEHVSWQLLGHHLEFCRLFANALAFKAGGDEISAYRTFEQLTVLMAPLDFRYHDCYDHFLACRSLENVFKIRVRKSNEEVIR